MIIPALACYCWRLLISERTIQSARCVDTRDRYRGRPDSLHRGQRLRTTPSLSCWERRTGGALAHAVLPPHGVLRYRYPRGTAEGLWVDFVSQTENGVAHTGPVALGYAGRSGSSPSSMNDNVFTQHGESVHWVQPRAEPWARSGGLGAVRILQLSTHVPVPKPITPSKTERSHPRWATPRFEVY